MANEEFDEEIVIAGSDDEYSHDIDITPLEDETVIEQTPNLAEEDDGENKVNKKTIILLASLIIVALLLIILLVVVILKKSDAKHTPSQVTQQIVEKIQKKQSKPSFTPSKIDHMLKKANALYESGNKMEALDIYKNIASYNEAISQYNIGVAKMKEEDFKSALNAFKIAILNKEKRTVSALNAAVCALRLEDEALFKYYLDLAYTYLPEESNSPLYSYYVGLINFYKQNYYEALSALTHPSSNHYKDKQAYLASKILNYTDSPHLALNSLQNEHGGEFTKGLLHARLGEFSQAKNNLIRAINLRKDKRLASMALSFVELKLGNFTNAANILNNMHDKNASYAQNTYPIKVALNGALFDVNEAQNEYKEQNQNNKRDSYAMLFYFAPYKVFNARQTIELIRKGSINVLVDDLGAGLDYLKTSSTISKINISLSEGIKLALNHHYLQANAKFKSLTKLYSKHAILHYDLALTYAQIGNFSLAYKHFKTSYRLDSKNYLAGLFAVMCAEIINKEHAKLFEEVKRDIDADESIPRVNFFMTLAHFIDNNQFSMNRWLETDKSEQPLHLAFDLITAKMLSNSFYYKQKATKLKSVLPNDMLAKILAFNAKYSDKNVKEYAKMIQIEFKNLDFDMNAFYYGSSIVKERFVKMLQISGLLHKQRDKLKRKLQVESKDKTGIMQALAFLDIYTNDFEEAYVLYNSLLDNHEQQDTNTLFYAAVASIGSNHPENAIALLELAKLTDPNNFESRYALGLLYQQTKNIKAATTQYNKIGNTGFKSKYFTFKITQ